MRWTLILLSILPLCVTAQEAYWLGNNNTTDEMSTHNLISKDYAGYSATNKIEGSYGFNLNVYTKNRFITENKIDHSSGKYTINFWLRYYQSSGDYLIWTNRASSTGQGVAIKLSATNNRISVSMRDGSTEGIAYSELNAVNNTAGFFVSVRVNGEYAKIYINGSQSGTDTTGLAGSARNDTVSIGSYRDGSLSLYAYLDNVSDYTCLLSQSQISELYANQTSEYTVTCGAGTPPVTGNKIYFDYTSGSDAGAGTIASPYKTIAKLKALTLTAGDSVLFKRGEVWDEVAYCVNNVDGTSSAPIYFGAYGTGANPLFKGTGVFTGFTNSGTYKWTLHDHRIKATKESYIDWWNGSSQSWDKKTSFLGNIFINGVAYGLSRYPNVTPLSFETVDETSSYSYVEDNLSMFSYGAFNGLGVQLKVMQGNWAFPFTTVTTNTTTRLNISGYNDFNPSCGLLVPGAKGMLFNSTHALIMNSAGEFYHDYLGQNITIYWTTDINNETVEIPVVDSIFCVNNSDYVTIDGIDFKGSRVMGVKFHGGIGDKLLNSNISYCANNAVHLAGTTNPTVDGCNLSYSDNGIYSVYTANAYYTDNYISQIGQDPALGDLDNSSGNGIYASAILTNLHITGNAFNTINYNGIHLHANKPENSPPWTVKNNYGTNWCNFKSDGGFIYTYGFTNNQTRYIRGNFGYNASDPSVWLVDNGLNEGIYNDEGSSYVTVDSNTIVNTTSGYFQHYSCYTNTINANNFINFSKAGYGNAGFFAEVLGDVYQLTFTNNEIVATDNASQMITWNSSYNNDWYCPYCDIDHNKYFSPLSTNTHFKLGHDWIDYESYTSLAAWRTKTGMDANSTLKFNSTLSSTQAVAYVNYSNTPHTFNLGTATFVDYGGTAKSGTISVPAYRSTILYKTGGTLDGDNPIYIRYSWVMAPGHAKSLLMPAGNKKVYRMPAGNKKKPIL